MCGRQTRVSATSCLLQLLLTLKHTTTSLLLFKGTKPQLSRGQHTNPGKSGIIMQAEQAPSWDAARENEDGPGSFEDLPLAATSDLIDIQAQTADALFGSSYKPVPPVGPHAAAVSTPAAASTRASQPVAAYQPQELKRQQNEQVPFEAAEHAAVSSPGGATGQLAAKLAWSTRLAEFALSEAVPQHVLAAAVTAAALASSPHASPTAMRPPSYQPTSPTRPSTAAPQHAEEHVAHSTQSMAPVLQSSSPEAAAAAAHRAHSPANQQRWPQELTMQRHTVSQLQAGPDSQQAYQAPQQLHPYGLQMQGGNVWVSEGELTSSPSANTAAACHEHQWSSQQQPVHAFAGQPDHSYTTQQQGDDGRNVRTSTSARLRRSLAGAPAVNPEVERWQAQIAALDNSNQELSRRLAELTAQLEQAQAQQAKHVDAMQAARDKAMEAETRLKSREQQLQVSEQHVDALTGELTATRAALAKEKSAHQETQDQVVVWRGEHQSLARELEAATRKLNQAGLEERKLQFELQQRHKEHDALADALNKSRVELSEARERLRQATAQAQQQGTAAARAEMDNDGLGSQLVQMRQKVAEVEQRNAVLMDEMRLLRQELAAHKQLAAGAAKLNGSPHHVRAAGRMGSADGGGTSHLLPGPAAHSSTSHFDDLRPLSPIPLATSSPPSHTAATASEPWTYPQQRYQPGRPAGVADLRQASTSYSAGASAQQQLDQQASGGRLSSSALDDLRAALNTAAVRKAQAENAAGAYAAQQPAQYATHWQDAAAPLPPRYNTWDAPPASTSYQPPVLSTRQAAPYYDTSAPSHYSGSSASLQHLAASSGYPGYTVQGYGPSDAMGASREGHSDVTRLLQQESSYHARSAATGPPFSPPTTAATTQAYAAGSGQFRDSLAYGPTGHTAANRLSPYGTYGSTASHHAMPRSAYSAGAPSSLAMKAAGAPLPPWPSPTQGSQGAGTSLGVETSCDTGNSKPDQQQQTHRPGLDVPYGTERTLKDLLARSQVMEHTLVGLCTERTTLEAEYAKLPLHGGRNTRQRNRKAEIESRMEVVQKEISNLRLALKKLHGK